MWLFVKLVFYCKLLPFTIYIYCFGERQIILRVARVVQYMGYVTQMSNWDINFYLWEGCTEPARVKWKCGQISIILSTSTNYDSGPVLITTYGSLPGATFYQEGSQCRSPPPQLWHLRMTHVRASAITSCIGPLPSDAAARLPPVWVSVAGSWTHK